MPRLPVTVSLLLLPLSACNHVQEDSKTVSTQFQQDSSQVATNVGNGITAVATQVRDNVRVTGDRLHKWLIEPPPASKPPHAIKASYCYTALQDILCYRQPMPGWENRLVGYQGTNAEPPPPAIMEPIPVREVVAAAPASRLASVQPVFIAPPPVVKDEVKDPSQAATTPDASHEQLPDPALAPQL